MHFNKSKLFFTLLVILSLVVVALIVIQALTTIHSINAHREDRARVLAKTIVASIRGVVQYGPDTSQRLKSVLSEVTQEESVIYAVVLNPEEQVVFEVGKTIPEVSGVTEENIEELSGNRLIIRTPFEIEQCGKRKRHHRRCSLQGNQFTSGQYTLVLLLATPASDLVKSHIIMESGLLIAIFFTMMVFVRLFVKIRQRGEALSQQIALETQKRESVETLANLAAGLAHEIRNPLGAIRGYAQLTHEDVPEGHLKDYSQLMLTELDRVSERLEEFLGFARERKLKGEKVNLLDLAREVSLLFEPDAASKEIKLFCGGDPVTLIADAVQLKELLINLVINAVQACEARGEVKIFVSAIGHGKISVTDTGVGIPPEMKDRILTPYVTTKGGGTGLGLAISARIAEAHGASLHFEDNYPQGTRVTLSWAGESNVIHSDS